MNLLVLNGHFSGKWVSIYFAKLLVIIANKMPQINGDNTLNRFAKKLLTSGNLNNKTTNKAINMPDVVKILIDFFSSASFINLFMSLIIKHI